MDGITFPVFGFHQVGPVDFVQFWDQFYDNDRYNEEFYQKNIGKPVTEQQHLDEWFKWKNGRTLSATKGESIRRYLSEEPINGDAKRDSLEGFLNRPGGAIWRIFWLHLQYHKIFPIYDQHVHRAMAFLLNWPVDDREIPGQNEAKVRMYLDHYRPFVTRFGDCEHRTLDRALWSFGRFLGTDYGKRIFAMPRPDSSN